MDKNTVKKQDKKQVTSKLSKDNSLPVAEEKVNSISTEISCNSIQDNKDEEDSLIALCRGDELLKSVDDDESFDEFVSSLIDQVCDEVDKGLYSFEPAKIGYDMYSDTVVYDYDLMMKILMANGYCPDCSETFIDSFAYCQSKGERGEMKNDFIVIVRKEQAEVDCMRCEYEKRVSSKRAKAKKASKKAKK